MIDWGLAERVADSVAGAAASERLPGDLAAMAQRAQVGVIAYTRLQPAAALPSPEAVGRPEWSRANLATMRATLDPVLERFSGLARRRGGLLGGPLRAATGMVLAAEIGGIVGFMGRNVLGQYEMRLLDPAWPPRLLLVEPNLQAAAASMNVDREQLLEWVVFHEVTHAVQFSGVPWLRDHLAGMLRELLSTLDVDIDPSALLRLPKGDDLRGWWEGVREGGLVTAVTGPERKATIDRLQATMALIEGHAEHVMDAAGAAVLPTLPQLRDALDRRRRHKPPLIKLVERLLGLDLKLRQYVVGKRFCDAVVAAGGIEALNRAWSAPELLPTLAELDDPDAWLARTDPQALPPAA